MTTATSTRARIALSLILMNIMLAFRLAAVAATVPTGMTPTALAVNPATNKIYVVNNGSNNVTVIDGATNATQTVSAGLGASAVVVNPATNTLYVSNYYANSVAVIDGETATTQSVTVGTYPGAVAVNPATNKVYVVNNGTNNVTVIDGATNTTHNIAVQLYPIAVAVNPATNQIYVGNYNSNSVTVIDGATNATAVVSVGSHPSAVAVNPVTNKIYVANSGGANVSIIDGATRSTTTVSAGANPGAIAVNPVTNKIYVANQGGPGVTVIDGATNTTTTVTTGSGPSGVSVDTMTNKIYVANYSSNNVTLIDGATNATQTVAAGTGPGAIAANPVTNRIYVTNQTNNTVTVLDGATNAVRALSFGSVNDGPGSMAVNPVTNKIYVVTKNNYVTVIDGATNTLQNVVVGTNQSALAVDLLTDMIYVSVGTQSVVVIDGATNKTTCCFAVGTTPDAIAVNPVTHLFYVANYGSNNLTVSNKSAPLATGAHPRAVAVNPATNEIYVACYYNVTVVDGATNMTHAIGMSGNPSALAVNSLTNKIYVATDSGVTVIDGATNSTSTISAGSQPVAVAVNPVTNKIYVANYGSNNISVIDGSTNATQTLADTNAVGPRSVAVDTVSNKIYVGNLTSNNVTIIDGVTNALQTVVAGTGPDFVAVNPVTNKVYVANGGVPATVTVITEQQVQPIPLGNTISQLSGNTTVERTPTFTFTANSLFTPTAPTPQAVWYQSDSWQGAWLPASGVAPTFTGSTSSLSVGPHILYAFATDGQDATSTGRAQQLIGSMAAYLFNVVPASTITTLSSDPNPSTLGESVTFTAYVTVVPPGSGTPTGSVAFYDESSSSPLSTVALDGTGHATYATSALTIGLHGIYATYGGDANFLTSGTDDLDQVVKATTSTALYSDHNPSNPGDSVTFTAYVTVTPPGSGTPTGTVTFLDGSATMGSAALDGSGHAVYATSALAGGAHNITASYGGDTNFLGSTSNVVAQVVGSEAAALSPVSLTFPGQALNTTSVAKVVKLTSTGNIGLDISSIIPSGNFAQTNNCPASLAAGKSCNISVTFTPTVSGKIPGALTIYDKAANSPQVVTLSGTGLTSVSASPVSISFGNVNVGATSAAKTVTAVNNSAASVSLSFAASDSYAANPGASNGCSATLGSKKKCTIAVTFLPNQNGAITGVLTIQGDTQLVVVNLSGNGVGGTAPVLSFDPKKTTIQEELMVGQTSQVYGVKIINKGSGTVTIGSLKASNSYSVTAGGQNPCGGPLAPGAYCTILIQFKPGVIGKIQGSVEIGNSTSINPLLYSVVGTGHLPVDLRPSSLTFPAQPVGTTSAPQTFWLVNHQAVPLHINTFVASGQYSVASGGSQPCGSDLPAWDNCTLAVTFTPSTKGTIKGVATVGHDAIGSPQVVSLSGTGQ